MKRKRWGYISMHGTAVNGCGWRRAERGYLVCSENFVESVTCIDQGGGHVKLAHLLEHYAVVGSVECSFELHMNFINVFIPDFGVLHKRDY
jgi:hypothetical protein